MLGDTWFSFLQDGQKSASPNWPKQASKDQMLAKKIEDPYFKWFMHSFIFLTHPPPPSTSWFSPSAGFVKCRCLYVSVRVRAEASWLEYVTFWKKVCQMMYFWLFFFFFFYSTDIIHKTNPIRRWHIYQFPTSAHKRPADSYVPCCLAWLILTTTTSPAWGLTDRVKWCHRPFILKIRSLWLSTGLCCSLCRLFFFFHGFCSDDPHM